MTSASLRAIVCAGAAMVGAASAAHATVSVAGNSSTVTDLGLFPAGSYAITATGVVSLAGPLGNGFDILPNGVPATPVTFPGFAYFNPSGSDVDIPDGDLYGPGGVGRDLGALLGTLDATPTSPSDFFIIGSNVTELLTTAEHIYALVNDTNYSDNSGAFTVAVSSVPEPSTWAVMLIGIGGVGALLRGRRGARLGNAQAGGCEGTV